MARPRERTIVTRLADAGEEAIQRLGGAPGADRLLGAVNSLRERMDDMQKGMRTIATIEKQLATIERRLDRLEGKSAATRSRSTSRKTSSRPRKKTS